MVDYSPESARKGADSARVILFSDLTPRTTITAVCETGVNPLRLSTDKELGVAISSLIGRTIGTLIAVKPEPILVKVGRDRWGPAF
jgi:hypothetical protein